MFNITLKLVHRLLFPFLNFFRKEANLYILISILNSMIVAKITDLLSERTNSLRNTNAKLLIKNKDYEQLNMYQCNIIIWQ